MPIEQRLTRLADQVFADIANAFPVCAASDEFYFFPQVVSNNLNWQKWDDFSSENVLACTDRLRHYVETLDSLKNPELSVSLKIDIELLHSTLCTLREQLIEVAPQTTQPTFHLTILTAGLTEALAGQPEAWAGRIAGLPEFLQQAADSLVEVPRLFLAPGLTMAQDQKCWLQQLQAAGLDIGKALPALDLFVARLKKTAFRDDFRLPEDQFAQLLSDHFGCKQGLDDVQYELTSEWDEMEQRLNREAARLAPGRRWQDLDALIPYIEAPCHDLRELYRRELERMEEHVRQAEFIPPELQVTLKPQLEEVPATMTAVRASDAYTATPGTPPRGGIFFIYPHDDTPQDRVGRHLEYRMTAAHETWPGHHLLDVCRWSLPQQIRRSIERPLCYEGWACLAEELMYRSGYFDNSWDPFLLARRRIRRAARGLADIGLQTGQMRLEEAARLLERTGIPPKQAAAMIPKYALRPGYQVCYAFGLRLGLKLLETYGANDPAAFARTMLRKGQIGFASLEEILSREGVS